MRDYSKIAPTFWTGETGKQIRRRGMEGVVVSLYLLSSPHSNMLGLFYQPTLYMAHETGLGIEGASKGLQSCIEAGFCQYDEATEMVWIPEMASYQIGSNLSSNDKRCKGIQKDYEALPNNPFLRQFFDRYEHDFKLSRQHSFCAEKPAVTESLGSPIEAPSKPGTGTGTGTGDKDTSYLLSELEDPSSENQNSELFPTLPTCPHRALIGLYHAKCPTLPRVRTELWGGSKAGALRSRWKWVLTAKREGGQRYATSENEALAWFGKFFDAVAESDFLSGRNGQWTACNLAWLVKAENFAKVVQGNYENRSTR